MIKRKGLKAGIKKNKLHFHSLRHTFSKKLYEKSNNNILLVSKVLGHKSLNYTQIYLQTLDVREIEKALTVPLFDIV